MEGAVGHLPHGLDAGYKHKSPAGRGSSSGVLAETEGFEPSMQVLPAYSLSRGAPSASRSRLRRSVSAHSSLKFHASS